MNIPTWNERCESHPGHQTGTVTHAMIVQRMQEEIDDLRKRLAELRERLPKLGEQLQHYIGTAARRSIEIGIIEALLDDKDYESTALDMEYWDDRHDKVVALHERIAALEAENAALRGWLSVEAFCVCCGMTDVCAADCTFAAEAPGDAAHMNEVRALLRGGVESPGATGIG